MNTDETWTLLVKKAVDYTDVDGTTRSISAGKHRITAVRAQGVPTGETELECWIIKESPGTDGEITHDVDAETVTAWQESGVIDIGEPAAS